jgi:hypothetical protein
MESKLPKSDTQVYDFGLGGSFAGEISPLYVTDDFQFNKIVCVFV